MQSLRFLLAYMLPLSLLCCSGSTAVNSNRESSQRPPNIIYILADDLGYGDLSAYGQKKFNTPHIDSLAKEGKKFTAHYSGSTVCAPSRSALITGLHTGHTPVRGNKEVQPEGQAPLITDRPTLAEILKEAGYATGAFGKWGLGFPGSESAPEKMGFDTFFGYNCQRLGHSYYPYHLWDNDQRMVLEANAGTATGVYAPDLIHQKALSFIEDHKDEPFFLYYPSIIPHAELAAPPELMQEFSGKYGPEKPFKGIDGGPRYRTGGYASQAEPRATFAAMVTLLDRQVGEIRTKLEDLGIADNTIIIFTSDNGPHTEGGADPEFFDSNGIYRGTKRDLYEGGIRVPMIAYWPGKINAGQSDHISAMWDVLPTFCEIAGAEIPSNIDGISFLPELLGRDQRQHENLYWEFLEEGGKQAVRKGDWKAVRLNVSANRNAPIALYNLATDPGERLDLALKYPEIVKEMAAIMEAEHEPSEMFTW